MTNNEWMSAKKLVEVVISAVISLSALTCLAAQNDTENTSGKPNFLIIVADDLGFSDLGSFGGEIDTPSLDRLAGNGVKLTGFYTAPTCSPTRSMLLSGVDSHLAGLGNMAELMTDEQRGRPGYEGYLNFQVAALPELLRDAGYHTYMAGKWHLGKSAETGPAARGFEESFAVLEGASSHFDDRRGALSVETELTYVDNGKNASIPKGFYSSAYYTDKLISYIDENLEDGKPFFAYAAYTAPHWPLQAPDKDLKKYQGRYDQGYEPVRKARLARMKQLGIIAPGVEKNLLMHRLPDWETLSQKQRQIEARRMEVYAAMVDSLDQHIGRLIDYLEQKGELDNTFVLFISDNGADGGDPHGIADNARWIPQNFNNSLANMGKKGSFVHYGPQWAQVSATPFSHYKTSTREGGIRVPGIIHYPPLLKSGSINHAIFSVMDVVPTLLELAHSSHPEKQYKGQTVIQLQGNSMLGVLRDGKRSEERLLGWELFGRKAVRFGDWKAVMQDEPYGNGGWQLYNLALDPTEKMDLSVANHEIMKHMLGYWSSYEKQNGVISVKIKVPYLGRTCVFEYCM